MKECYIIIYFYTSDQNDILKFLAENGANVNVMNSLNQTALSIVAQKGNQMNLNFKNFISINNFY